MERTASRSGFKNQKVINKKVLDLNHKLSFQSIKYPPCKAKMYTSHYIIVLICHMSEETTPIAKFIPNN